MSVLAFVAAPGLAVHRGDRMRRIASRASDASPALHVSLPWLPYAYACKWPMCTPPSPTSDCASPSAGDR